MILWFIVLIWQAYQDWRTLTVHAIGNLLLLLISLFLGSIQKVPFALLLYIGLHGLNLSKPFKQSMGEGDRQLLAISMILLPWNSWCYILWLSLIPCIFSNRTQHPFFTYYTLSHLLYYNLS